MERNLLFTNLVAAVFRVIVCLPSTFSLFKFLKRRYTGSQISELNAACKWRGLRVSSLERIGFLKDCLDNSVVPRGIYDKVKRLRPRFASSIGRAFIKNEIVVEEERFEKHAKKFRQAWRHVGTFLSFTDWIRFNKLLGENGCRLRNKLRCQYLKRLEWLKTKRFGSEELNTAAVFNLSRLELSRVQLEVLSRGPRFGIPPAYVCKEDVFSEFELYFNRLQSLLSQTPRGKEKEEKLKVKLANLAHEYVGIRRDRLKCPLGKKHLDALHELRHNKDIVITRPDKGAGTVVMDTVDYTAKMLQILNDTSKFEYLGSCEDNDRTGQHERALQAFLLRQCKQGDISSEVYDRVRPTGSLRPRMYGLPKVHKAKPIPLRPILSMVGSAQHELARWLAEVLQPVLTHYSFNVVKDSFSFCDDLREYGPIKHDAFMCSFDVVSLFTNVPIDETIQICLDTLYRSNLDPPKISEGLLRKLLIKCTRDVEFSFDDKMYRQIDGVAMGSPLGPVLANIFLGYCESLIPDDMWPYIYRRFVDDTFSVVDCQSDALRFLECLNSLHPALRFTMESEENGQLSFMDVLVMKENESFSMTIYRKPTFTCLYTRWDSYCSTGQKIALIRSLTHRAKRICSTQYIGEETTKLKVIFEKNGYPTPIVERVIEQTLKCTSPAEQAKLEKVYIRLPWLGANSAALANQICKVTKDVLPVCKPTCVFTTRRMFNTCKKDVLPAESLSNVVYLFNCACGLSYVGRTTQRLAERVKQHVPPDLVDSETVPGGLRRKPGRPRKSERVTAAPQPSSTRVLRSMVRAETAAAQVPSKATCPDTQEVTAQLKGSKSDSAITKHLKLSPECRRDVCADVLKCFKILARGRSANHLAILEALFIDRNKPGLCSQKEHVRCLELF